MGESFRWATKCQNIRMCNYLLKYTKEDLRYQMFRLEACSDESKAKVLRFFISRRDRIDVNYMPSASSTWGPQTTSPLAQSWKPKRRWHAH
jgi:hypothetical protein